MTRLRTRSATYHVFAENGLMLLETTGQNPSQAQDIRLVSFTSATLRDPFTRAYQVLHVLLRPVSLRLSAYFAYRLNRRRVLPKDLLAQAIANVEAGDSVVFMNPSLATVNTIEALLARTTYVNLYFLDPIRRLGITPEQISRWRRRCRCLTYSRSEALEHRIAFLEPFAPALPPASSFDYDLVYVGSPSPRRLLWVTVLRALVALAGARAYLSIATRRVALLRLWPSMFSPRLSFSEYAALCAKSRGLLELHERDAEGVTLRATLARSLGIHHLSNVQTTPDTVLISPIWNGELWGFLKHTTSKARPNPPPRTDPSIFFDGWLRAHFRPPASQ